MKQLLLVLFIFVIGFSQTTFLPSGKLDERAIRAMERDLIAHMLRRSRTYPADSTSRGKVGDYAFSTSGDTIAVHNGTYWKYLSLTSVDNDEAGGSSDSSWISASIDTVTADSIFTRSIYATNYFNYPTIDSSWISISADTMTADSIFTRSIRSTNWFGLDSSWVSISADTITADSMFIRALRVTEAVTLDTIYGDTLSYPYGAIDTLHNNKIQWYVRDVAPSYFMDVQETSTFDILSWYRPIGSALMSWDENGKVRFGSGVGATILNQEDQVTFEATVGILNDLTLQGATNETRRIIIENGGGTGKSELIFDYPLDARNVHVDVDLDDGGTNNDGRLVIHFDSSATHFDTSLVAGAQFVQVTAPTFIADSISSRAVTIYDDDADPALWITAAHATDYDPQIKFSTDASPTVKFSMGVDGANDNFVLANTSSVGGQTDLNMSTAGDVSLGIAPSTLAKLYLYENTQETDSRGLLRAWQFQSVNSGSASQNIRTSTFAIDARAFVTSGFTNTGYIHAMDGGATHVEDGTASNVRALKFYYGSTTACDGAITNLSGVDLEPYHGGTAVITNSHDIFIRTPSFATATVTNDWCIYSAHAAPSRFVDDIRISADAASFSLGVADDATISFDGSDLVINSDSVGNGSTLIGETANHMEVEPDGGVVFVGTGGLAYGEIWAYDTAWAAPIAVAGKANKVQVICFQNDGASNNTTPDYTNDHITITKAGHYMCNISASVLSGPGAGFELGISLWKNNGATEFQNIHAHRNLTGGGGDVGSITLSGIVDLAANDTMEVWVWNETNTVDVIVDDVTLSLVQVGGT